MCTDVDPAVAATAEEAGGSSTTGDLSDPVAAEAVIPAALDRYGRVDVV